MRKKSLKVVVVVLVAGILSAFFLTGNATATTAVAVDTEFMTNRATAVVLATVVSLESRWNDAHTKIYTFTVVDVQDDFKGKTKGRKITVRQLGGRVGNIACYVPGQPTLRKGEKILAFLRPSKKDKARFCVVGMAQGKYSVLEDGTAVRDLNGLHLMGAGQERAREESRMPTDKLIEKVRAIAAGESRQQNADQEESAR